MNLTVQFELTANAALYCVLLFVGALPSVVYLVVYPLAVGNVTVIFPFVQPVGLIDALPIVGSVNVELDFAPPTVSFPAASFAFALNV